MTLCADGRVVDFALSESKRVLMSSVRTRTSLTTQVTFLQGLTNLSSSQTRAHRVLIAGATAKLSLPSGALLATSPGGKSHNYASVSLERGKEYARFQNGAKLGE